ncbi:MAG: CRISPR-associated protein Cas4 [bacterium]|nr:CRISPR-associated protein Cas4 [bacterium]
MEQSGITAPLSLSDLYDEDELVMISALQHYLYCRRRCALVHIEQQWQENLFTAEGRLMHERVHKPGAESRRKVRVEYSLSLRSLRLGLSGQADIVEFHLQEDGFWLPLPVEYKRGRPKKDDTDRVQLCAQALCLEEMLNCTVPEGALYYGQKQRRYPVVFDQTLRHSTQTAAAALHELLRSEKTPGPEFGPKCGSCSLLPRCLPTAASKKSVATYLHRMVAP